MTTVLDGLYPFQREDVSYLRSEPHVLNANEMGTGKTWEAIALDQYRRQDTEHIHPKTLVVAPLAVLPSWHRHFTKLTNLKVRQIDRKARHRLLEDTKADVYLVHWEALRLMPELRDVIWTHIIADEVHKAKNRKAKQTRALKRLRAAYKTGLSGTPVINAPHEFWSVLNWLYPQRYNSFWNFYKRYVDFEVIYPHGYHKILGPKNERRLLEQIEPFYVRRLKMDVLKDLPDKYYTEIPVELGPRERRAYDAMRKDMIAWLGEHEDQPLVAPVVIAQLIRLQQFALGLADIDEEGKVVIGEPSSKLDALMSIIEDMGDQQVVIFSQFEKAARMVVDRLEAADISVVKYTGANRDERDQLKDEFQEGKHQVLVGTIKAGGVGIDLFAASTVIFLDRDWSPALNLQAEDRLHRQGQKNAVHVIDLMARDTVDLGRKQKLVQKISWIRSLLGDE